MYKALPNGKNTDIFANYKQTIVEDNTMAPFFYQGDTVIIDRMASPASIQSGDIWLVRCVATGGLNILLVKIGTHGLIMRHTNPDKLSIAFLTPNDLRSNSRFVFMGRVVNYSKSFAEDYPHYFVPSLN